MSAFGAATTSKQDMRPKKRRKKSKHVGHLEGQDRGKFFNMHFPVSRHSLFCWQENGLMDELVHVFISLSLSSAHLSEIRPGLRDAAVCHQMRFTTGFSALRIWETKTSCGPWGQGAVGGSLRTSGRGRVFCKTQVALIIPSTERKGLAILAQRILCVAKSCSVRLCAHNS